MEDYKVTKMPSPIDILLISFIQFFLHRGGTMEVGVGWGRELAFKPQQHSQITYLKKEMCRARQVYISP